MKHLWFLFLPVFYSCEHEKYSDDNTPSEKIAVFTEEEKINFSCAEADSLYDQGLKLEANDQDNMAEQAYTKALELDPDNVYILRRLANISRNNGDINAAEKYLIKGLQVDSNDLALYVNYCLLFLNDKNNRPKAISLGLAGIKRFPETSHKGLLYFNMAVLFYNENYPCAKVQEFINKSRQLLGEEFPEQGEAFSKEVEDNCL